jgi:ABC-type transport system involved in multi-copper enzyme maturation permease subunit
VNLTFRRQWRVRALGWVTLGLVLLIAFTVGIITHVRDGWRLEKRRIWVANTSGPAAYVQMSYQDYADERLTYYQMLPMPSPYFATSAAVFAPFRAIVQDQEFLNDYAFMNFSRWVVYGLYLGFVLPLFSLAFASGAVGADRESRTLIWLMMRPLPRWAVYLAKLLGVMPWSVAVAMASFALICGVGGTWGRMCFVAYWPAILVGAVSFTCLFVLVGAVFRRPAVLGLVYIFFFETLVANLPGSLKQLSLNYYIKSLMYNEVSRMATAATPEALDVYAPATPSVCWQTLLLASVAITILGMWLFNRFETPDEA